MSTIDSNLLQNAGESDKNLPDTYKHDQISRNLWIAAWLVSLQPFLFGYVFSCMNSCIVTGDNGIAADCYHGVDSSCPKGTLVNDLDLTDIEIQLTTSLTVLGAWVGSLYGNHPAHKYGRQKTLLFNTLFFLLGGGMSACGNFYALFIGRLISGIGVGIASAVSPVLLSEIASDANRGTITTLNQVMITFAIFVAAIVAYGFVQNVNHGWQYVLGLGALPAALFIFCAPIIPESPKWLVIQNRVEEARKILLHLRFHPDLSEQQLNGIVDREINDIQTEHEGGKEHSEKSSDDENKSVSWKEVLVYKKALIIGCGLMFFQAMTGINTVIFYSTSIFGYAGFNNSILATTMVCLCNLLTTILCAYVIDKFDRKTFLRTGAILMLGSLLILSSVLIQGNSGSTVGVIAVITVLVYIFGFAVGLGAVCWVIMSEVMPTNLRAKAMSLFLSINWGFNFLIGLFTLTAINKLGNVNTDADDDSVVQSAQQKGVAILYYIFSGFCVAFLLFLEFYVPETKGKTPQDILTKKTSKNGHVHNSNVPLLSSLNEEQA